MLLGGSTLLLEDYNSVGAQGSTSPSWGHGLHNQEVTAEQRREERQSAGDFQEILRGKLALFPQTAFGT